MGFGLKGSAHGSVLNGITQEGRNGSARIRPRCNLAQIHLFLVFFHILCNLLILFVSFVLCWRSRSRATIGNVLFDALQVLSVGEYQKDFFRRLGGGFFFFFLVRLTTSFNLGVDDFWLLILCSTRFLQSTVSSDRSSTSSTTRRNTIPSLVKRRLPRLPSGNSISL